MAGRMGSDRFTAQNLSIVDVDTENNLLLVKGAIPGPTNGLVLIRTAAKQALRKGGVK
jgi:large subunit ribosomal protein L3